MWEYGALGWTSPPDMPDVTIPLPDQPRPTVGAELPIPYPDESVTTPIDPEACAWSPDYPGCGPTVIQTTTARLEGAAGRVIDGLRTAGERIIRGAVAGGALTLGVGLVAVWIYGRASRGG